MRGVCVCIGWWVFCSTVVSHKLRLFPAQNSLTVPNRALKHHSCHILVTSICIMENVWLSEATGVKLIGQSTNKVVFISNYCQPPKCSQMRKVCVKLI